MATLIKRFGHEDPTITIQYDEDEVDDLPSWGDSFELGDDEDMLTITVGKKVFDKAGIAVFEVLAIRPSFDKD